MSKISTEINMEDCKMQFTTTAGVRVCIMDTVCRHTTQAEKEAIDTEIIQIYNDIQARVAATAART